MPARLITALFALCQLRIGPQDLPHRPALVLALLGLLLVLEGFKTQLVGPVDHALPGLVLSALYAVAATALLLQLRQRSPRFWQTLLALVGSGLVFSLLALPLLLLAGPADAAAASPLAPVLGWSLLLLIGWQLLVCGHIWRHALDVPLPLGVLTALALLFGELLLRQLLFGVADAGAAVAPA